MECGPNGNRLVFIGKRVYLRCIECDSTYEPDPQLILCRECGGLLEVIIEHTDSIQWSDIDYRDSTIWRYRKLLPVPEDMDIISLGEGYTPLVKAEGLGELFEHRRIYVKFEGTNPTGSFKDRGMSLSVSLAKYVGIDTFVVASTGNTSASAAAYVARAGGKCIVLIPHGKVAVGKLAQAILHGAYIIEVDGSFDDALNQVMNLIHRGWRVYPLNSINPWRLEGQKTIGYEIIEVFRDSPDWIIVPVGNAGNIYAIGKGILELYNLGLIDRLPRLVGVQAEGAAPLARLWREGLSEPIFIDDPDTIATAIRIGRPVNWRKAVKMVRVFNGFILDVTDSDILNAQKILAKYVGIGAEPAGAASLAGLKNLVEAGQISRDERVVIIVTGHALKDPNVILEYGGYKEIIAKPADIPTLVRRVLGGEIWR